MRKNIFSVAIIMIVSSNVIPNSQYFDSDGIQIHYIVQGQGEPVILVHGYSCDIEYDWIRNGVFDSLSQNYMVVALDLRGHGKSEKPHNPKEYGLKMIDDIINLMNHLSIQKAHFIGYSMGGELIVKMTTLYPDRFQSAIIVGAGWVEKNDFKNIQWKKTAEGIDKVGSIIDFWYPKDGEKKPDENTLKELEALDSKAMAAVAHGMNLIFVEEKFIKTNKIPMYAIIGEDDWVKPSVDKMKDIMPNLTIKVLDERTHVSAMSDPRLIEEIEKILEYN